MFTSIPQSAGEKIIRCVRAYENGQRGFGVMKREFPVPQPAPGLPFRNDAAEASPARAIMAVTGMVVDGDDWFITVTKPDTTFRRFYVVNDSFSVEAGGKGQCYDGGDGPVKILYDTDTPAFGESFGPQSGQWTLKKNYSVTSECLGIVDSGGKILLAMLHPIYSIIGKLTAALSQGETATVSVWGGVGGSEAAISGLTVTARDWLMKSGSDAITSGKKVVVEWINGIPYVTEAECA